jgi:hypothetical protein
MKIFVWLFLFQLFAFECYSQKFEPVNPRADKKDFHGYTIKLFPAFGNSYGYDIIKGKELIAHQSHNPFTTSPIGLSNKQDVYKVAEWQIEQSGINEKLPRKNFAELKPKLSASNSIFFYKPVPVEVAKELQIKISR